MEENVLDNELIKKIQKIEEKFLKKYIRNDLKDLVSDVINNKCKNFKENVFYKQVKEIDDESNDFGYKNKDNKNNIDQKIINFYKFYIL